MKRATGKDNEIVIKIGGEDFYSNLELIKSIAGRRFDPVTKEWFIPLTNENIEVLHSRYFDLRGNLSNAVLKDISEEYKNFKLDLPDVLYDFQKESLQFVEHHKKRAYLGLPMGSGKTLVSLTHIVQNKLTPALVICPSPVKLGFKRDYAKFISNFDYQPEMEILYGLDSVRQYSENKIYVINYELLSLSMESKDISYIDSYGNERSRKIHRPNENLVSMGNTGFKCIVADEAHRLKNEDAKAFKAFKFLSKNCGSILCMSGTPILNRPAEIFGCVNILKPNLFKKREFLNKFCDPKVVPIGKGRTILQFKGSTNEAELHNILRNNVLINFNKTDILKDLPDINRIVVPLEVNQAEYNKDKIKVLEEIEDDKRVAITLFEFLKQSAVRNKEKAMFDFIDETLEIEDKIVIFCIHQSVVEKIHNRYKNSVTYYGKDTDKQKEKNKDKFIKDKKIRIIIGNLESLGTGTDGLQKSGSSTIIKLELGWNPAQHRQAEDRIYRNGYEGKDKINVFYLCGQGTIEEEITELIDSKLKIVKGVTYGEETEEKDLLTNLMKKYIIQSKMKNGQ